MKGEWKKEKERSNPFTLRLICWIALNISRTFARFWLIPITVYFFITSPRVRFASRHYLQRIPGCNGSPWQVAKHIYFFSATVLDRVYFLTDQFHRFEFDIEGAELLDDIVDKKQGCILLGAHVGSFEALRCLAISHSHLPLKVTMYQDHNAMITKVLDELNPQVAGSVINLADHDALFKVKESIEAGGLIGMLGDRVLQGEKHVSCKLLGETIELPSGPVSLASLLDVPVVMFFGIYLGDNRYAIRFIKIADKLSAPRGEREDLVKMNMQLYACEIEKMITKHPYNWFNFFDYWGDDK